MCKILHLPLRRVALTKDASVVVTKGKQRVPAYSRSTHEWVVVVVVVRALSRAQELKLDYMGAIRLRLEGMSMTNVRSTLLAILLCKLSKRKLRVTLSLKVVTATASKLGATRKKV